jgi:hypothetical protein
VAFDCGAGYGAGVAQNEQSTYRIYWVIVIAQAGEWTSGE